MRVLLLQTLDNLRCLVEAPVRVLSAHVALGCLAELLQCTLLAEVVSASILQHEEQTLRRDHRLHELLTANEAREGKLFLVAALDHVFVVLVIIVHIYPSKRTITPTLSSLALLALLFLLLLPIAVLRIMRSMHHDNLPTTLVVASVVNELAGIAEGAVARLLVVLADLYTEYAMSTAYPAGSQTDC